MLKFAILWENIEFKRCQKSTEPGHISNIGLDGNQPDQILGAEAQVNQMIDPKKEWVIGPQMHPKEPAGLKIDPREQVDPWMDQLRFLRLDQVKIFYSFKILIGCAFDVTKKVASQTIYPVETSLIFYQK